MVLNMCYTVEDNLLANIRKPPVEQSSAAIMDVFWV